MKVTLCNSPIKADRKKKSNSADDVNRISTIKLSMAIRLQPPLDTYRVVVGPEVSQGEVVFVKVTLGQTLHNNNVHTFNLPLVVETTPTSRKTEGR